MKWMLIIISLNGSETVVQRGLTWSDCFFNAAIKLPAATKQMPIKAFRCEKDGYNA